MELCFHEGFCLQGRHCKGRDNTGAVEDSAGSSNARNWRGIVLATPHAQAPDTFSLAFPYASLQLHRLAVKRPVWNKLVGLPTCKKLLRSCVFLLLTVSTWTCESFA